MNIIDNVKVMMGGRLVGTCARMTDGMIAFQYDTQWLEKGFSISPLSLPLEDRVFIPNSRDFEGLFGVFDDSLPDGWGRLLVDRMLISRGERIEDIDALYRLTMAGQNVRGALEYVPDNSEPAYEAWPDLDSMANACLELLETDMTTSLDDLFLLGYSSGGARPKALVMYKGHPWIVKFRSTPDPGSIGLMEYEYNSCAEKCGIHVAPYELLDSNLCEGYFATRRFDRVVVDSRCGDDLASDREVLKIHMVSAAGLLESSHRIPSLDYSILFKLTSILNCDIREREELYRRMCFNVYAHNRDDHSRNFSYLYDDKESHWHLSPAYDMTYSSSLAGQHATTVAGNGENPGVKELVKTGVEAGLDEFWCKDTAVNIEEIVRTDLKDWIK